MCERSIRPGRLRRRALALLLIAALTGCAERMGRRDTHASGAAAGSPRTRTLPLATYRSAHPSRVAVEGKVRPERIQLPSGSQRAIVSSESHAIRFALDDMAGATLSGSHALLPPRAEDEPEQATFRVRLVLGAEGDLVSTLHEAVVRSGTSSSFELKLPDALPEDARLELSLELPESDAAGRSLAAWIEPVLRKHSARPVAPPRGAANLLLITSDTTRLDDLGCYGGPVRTPALNGLAKDGALLRNAHSVAYGTTPSHASLMTSLPAARHRVYDNDSILGEDERTLAETLAELGYRTAAIVGAAPLASALGLAQGFDLYDDGFALDLDSRLDNYSYHERRGSETVDRFAAWLDERPQETFFAWLHFFDPHQPYSPPGSYAEPYLPGHDAPGGSLDVEPSFVAQGRGPRYLDAEALASHRPELFDAIDRVARGQYRGEIAYVDEQIGRLRALLEQRGLYEHTAIVFVADHGENFGDRGAHLAFDHAGLHGEITRLPMLLKPPGAPAWAGSEHGFLAANIDLVPTLAELMGIEADPGWQGRSFLGAIETGGGAQHRDHLVLEGAHRHEIAVRTPRWLYREVIEGRRRQRKILRYQGYAPKQPFELYDLRADPEERTNVFSEDHPALTAIRERLARFEAASGEAESERLLSPEHTEALRALGYIE